MTPLTLEEALLAPLDAIFRAQVHAARSLLSFLLQIGYPHEKDPENPQRPAWPLKFLHESVGADGTRERHVVQMPALALVPIAPLAVQDASFKFKMAVTDISRDYQQYQPASAHEARREPPWWLIKPRVLTGNLAPEGAAADSSMRSIEITINVAKTAPPAGLEKLITALTQVGGIVSREPIPPTPGAGPSSSPTSSDSTP